MNTDEKDKLLRELREQKARELKEIQLKKARLNSDEQSVEQDIAAINQLLKSAANTVKSRDVGLPSGFRDAVRAVLTEFPGGMTNPEIRKHMEMRGYRYGPEMSTPFGTRMANELTRMKEQGQVRKDVKRYVLTEKGRAL